MEGGTHGAFTTVTRELLDVVGLGRSWVGMSSPMLMHFSAPCNEGCSQKGVRKELREKEKGVPEEGGVAPLGFLYSLDLARDKVVVDKLLENPGGFDKLLSREEGNV